MSKITTRKLTHEEYELARWLLEHGNADAAPFLEQLERAEATTWKCECGCVSFNFKVAGYPETEVGVRVLSDYLFGDKANPAGIFIFASNGVLGGVEVYGLASDPPVKLPKPSELQSWSSFGAKNKHL